MGLLYAWATKEYLLWRMSPGQIFMYNNLGIELKYGKPKEDGKPKPLHEMSHAELKAWQAEQDAEKAALGDKYGDTNG